MDYEIVEFHNQPAFRAWLTAHGEDANGIWLRIYEKASNITSITYAEAFYATLNKANTYAIAWSLQLPKLKQRACAGQEKSLRCWMQARNYTSRYSPPSHGWQAGLVWATRI
jgi:hypothetical protein